MPRRGRLPLVLLWTLVGLLLVLSLRGQIGLVIIQSSQQELPGMLGNSQPDRRLFSDIVFIAVQVMAYVRRAASSASWPSSSCMPCVASCTSRPAHPVVRIPSVHIPSQ